jgi:pimeloyl-ACP methyl ester carboxylesterase
VKATFDLGSAKLAALDRHPAAVDISMPTVLFVPGYTGSKEDFLPLLRPIAKTGFRAVAIDQRGQFESSWAGDPSEYLIESLAEDVIELTDQLRATAGQFHLVGHSFGGLVARAAALAKPELFTSLTLMGSGPAAISGQRLATLQSAEPILASQGMVALWDHMVSLTRPDDKYARASESLLRFLRTRFLSNDPVGLQVMGDELRREPDRTDELAATSLPMLVIHGVDDDAWPSAVQADMARRLGARYVVISAAAHSPAVENSAATIEALQAFWSELGPTAAGAAE